MRRKTTGTGRMRYMKDLTRRFKNGFREGTCRVESWGSVHGGTAYGQKKCVN